MRTMNESLVDDKFLSFFLKKHGKSDEKIVDNKKPPKFHFFEKFQKKKRAYENFIAEDIKKKTSRFFTRNIAKQRFFNFLFEALDIKTGYNFYIEKIVNALFSEKKNIHLSFQHLIAIDPLLALWTIDKPEEMLMIFKESCLEVIREVFPKFPTIFFGMCIKIIELPICNSIRDLNRTKINCLVKTKGTVISKTNTFPNLNLFRLVCLKCIQLQKTVFSSKENWKKIFFTCFNCKSSGPFQLSWYKFMHDDFQTIIIQEVTRQFSSYAIPEKKEVILRGDLMDSVKIGQEIVLTGILKYKHTSITYENYRFCNFIEANHIERFSRQKKKISFTKKDEKKIFEISKKGEILFALISSFLPSFYGYQDIKLFFLLGIFSNATKTKTKNNLRHDCINILVIGDSGVGKTHFLKQLSIFLSQCSFFEDNQCMNNVISPGFPETDVRCENLNIKENPDCEEPKVLLIDEIEKLNTANIFKIQNEKKIKILNKRDYIKLFEGKTSIFATSQPINAYYQSNSSLAENTCLENDLISCFDLVCIMQDKIDPMWDEFLGKKVLSFNTNVKPKTQTPSFNFTKIPYRAFFEKIVFTSTKNLFSFELLKKYYKYAKRHIFPELDFIDHEIISNLYVSFRKEASLTKGIMITTKHLESLFRVVTASARIHLRQKAAQEDLLIGTVIFFKSFFHIQPFFIRKVLKVKLESTLFPFLKKYPQVSYLFKNFF